MTPDLIIDILKYYSKFIPKAVLKKIFIQSTKSRNTGYDEIKAEILSLPDMQVLPEFDAFVVSQNENFVSERMKNSKEYVLFVEYGSFSVNHGIEYGVKEKLAVAVVHNFSDNNNDFINETIHMNKCFRMLDEIIKTMGDEQDELGFCGSSLVDFPVDIQPVEPAAFYACGGWIAYFTKKNTIL